MPEGIEMNDIATVMTAFFGGLAVLAGAFFKYMSTREKAAAKEREDERKAFSKLIEVLSESTDKNTKAMTDVAKATRQSAIEAKERNGHLAELQLASQKMIADNLDAIHHVKSQTVEHQTVEREVVKEKK